MKTNTLSTFSAILLIAVWFVLIRMIIKSGVNEIGLLGFMSGMAFFIFSLQWVIQLVVSSRQSHKTKVSAG